MKRLEEENKDHFEEKMVFNAEKAKNSNIIEKLKLKNKKLENDLKNKLEQSQSI